MLWKVFRLAPLSVLIYPFLALISWLMTLLSYAMSPIIAGISMATGSNQVPWLRWFYTHDASLDGGIEQHIDGYDPNARGFKLWWQRVCWICRNPGYRFNAHVLGFAGTGEEDVVFSSGSRWPVDHYWYVVKSPTGRLYFGYRGKRSWFGWNYAAYGGYHQLKSKPFSFG